jgi:uncharacterized protein YraI
MPDPNRRSNSTNFLDYNCHVYKYFFFFALCGLLISGCGLTISTPDLSTPTIFLITATLPPTTPPPATATVQPSTNVPTLTTIEGTTSTKVNVRAEPSTAGATLSIIDASATIQIIGKDSGGNWYQIIFPQGPDGKGWVTAQYVTVKDKDAIKVIGAAPASTSGSGSGSISGPSGVIIQQVNVRNGPGTQFDALGTLNPKDVVTLIGKDSSGSWLEIAFAKAPDGKGWVASSYVQASGAENLPIVGGGGQVVGTGTPTLIPATITPTLAAALQDDDSPQAPAVNVAFTSTGTNALIYSSDVSTPNGDAEDWVGFTPDTASVSVSLTCAGNGKLNVELWQNNSAIQNWPGLACGENKTLNVTAGENYLVRLAAQPAGGNLEYVHYTLSIASEP